MIKKLIQTMLLVLVIPLSGIAAPPNIAIAPSDGAVAVMQGGALVPDKVTYTVYLTSDISLPSDYDTLTHLLKAARETDTVVLVINSPGGYVATMVMLLDSIEHTKAHTVANVTGVAASAAAMIMAVADEVHVSEGSYILFHFVQVSGSGGPVPTVKEEMEMIIKIYTPIFERICARYLTDAEMDAIFKGHDVVITSEDMQRRIRGDEVKSTVKEFMERVQQHAREVVNGWKNK